MLEWIQSNVANIVVVTILVAVTAAIIVKMIRDRKAGKSSCGGDCSRCAGACHCHCQPPKASADK